MASVLQIADLPIVNHENKDIESLITLDRMFIPMASDSFTVTTYGENQTPPSSPSKTIVVDFYFDGLPLPAGMSTKNHTILSKVSRIIRFGLNKLVQDDY